MQSNETMSYESICLAIGQLTLEARLEVHAAYKKIAELESELQKLEQERDSLLLIVGKK